MVNAFGGALAVTGPIAYRPRQCEPCREPWPCPTFRAILIAHVNESALLPVMRFMLRPAIKDSRGRAGQQEPSQAVKRFLGFLWFLWLSNEKAQTLARRIQP